MWRVCYPVIAAALLSSCAMMAPQKVMQSWVGHTDVELVQAWGQPLRIEPAPNGDRVWVYAYDRRYVTEDTRQTVINGRVDMTPENRYGRVTAVARETGEAPTVRGYIAYRRFWVRQGVVYRFSWDGL